MKNILMVLTLMVTSLSYAATNPTVTFGKVSFTGKGCPGKDASFTPSPDGKAFSLLFDKMTVDTDKSVDYIDCTMMIPFKVSPGYRLDIQTVDVRGFVNLDSMTAAQMGFYPRFMNYRGQMKNGGWHMSTRYGQDSGNITETFQMGAAGQSHCSGHTQWMIIHNRVTIYNWDPVTGMINSAAMDSLDSANKFSGKFALAQCQ